MLIAELAQEAEGQILVVADVALVVIGLGIHDHLEDLVLAAFSDGCPNPFVHAARLWAFFPEVIWFVVSFFDVNLKHTILVEIEGDEARRKRIERLLEP